MQIDQNSNVPMYEQIYQLLLEYINNSILQVKDRLPSVIAVSSMLHVNPNTVAKSYRMLEEKKYIHSIPGKGIFVSEMQQNKTIAIQDTVMKDCQKLIGLCKYMNMSYTELCNILKQKWYVVQ